MEPDSKLCVHDIIWQFSVTDPRLHTKGYTVYKVTCKNFPFESPEMLTEMVCWKRYNDIKILYKSLLTLHKAQQRCDPFPEFARPKLFGRFSDSVIENRRQSVFDLLNFISTQPHLYKSSIFKEFLEEGRVPSDFNKKGTLLSSRSSKLNVITDSLKFNVDTESDIMPKVEKHGQVNGSSATVESTEHGNIQPTPRSLEAQIDASQTKTEQSMLEGTWRFPQVADNISLGSTEDVDTDDESVLEGSLPDADLASFSPVSPKYSKTAADRVNRTVPQSTSWVVEGLHLCADLGSDSFVPGQDESNSNNKYATEKSLQAFNDSALNLDESLMCRSSTNSFSTLASHQDDTVIQNTTDVVASEGTCLEGEDLIIRMYQSSSSSKTECGRGDLDLSVELETRSSSFSSNVLTSSRRSESASSEYAKQLPRSDPAFKNLIGSSLGSQSEGLNLSQESLGRKTTQRRNGSFLQSIVSGNSNFTRSRSMTEQSISTMSLGGNEDYIYQAANQISKAQNREVIGDYEIAFAYYKSGVGILLHGVQGDTNKFRREVVRRKTAKYLMKAEDMFNRHLASDSAGELRWGNENFLAPSLDPSFAFIKGPAKELRNFQVLATLDKVILVRHKVTDETFVIKSISKSSLDTGSIKSVLPTSCPYMVSLHRFYETEDSVFLLLEYASGGKLWSYIEKYLNNARCSVSKQSISNTASSSSSPGMGSITSNKEVNTEQGKSNLNCVLNKNVENHNSHTVNMDANTLNHNSVAGLLRNAEALRLSVVNNQPDQIGETLMATNGNGTSNTDQNMYTPYQDVDIFNALDIIGIDNNSHKSQPLDQILLSLSDECPAVSELESSVITPVSLPDNSFHCLILENKADCDAFSITSNNSDTTNHNYSVCDNSFNISTSTDCNTSDSLSTYSTLNQTTAHEVSPVIIDKEFVEVNQNHSQSIENYSNFVNNFKATFDSDEIIMKSKELLTEVEKVLADTNNQTENNGNTFSKGYSDLKPVFLISSSEAQEGIIKSENVSSLIGPVIVTSDINCNVSSPSIQGWFDSFQSAIDVSEFVNGPGTSSRKSTNASEFHKNSLSSSSQTESAILNAVTENENLQRFANCSTANITSWSTQGKIPKKLSMNSKGIVRSSSCESDFRSPARSRATTTSYLSEHINSISVAPTEIPESCIRKWMAQMVTAIGRLHSLGVVCRDLNPNNILLGDGGQVHLTYFCKLGYDKQELDWDAKKKLYIAPEVGSVNRYDRSCDWWSIGALLYELVVGKSLVECHPGGINSHTCLHIPTFVSSEARALLEGLLRYNPNERLGAGLAGPAEIKAHPFFNGIDWVTMEYS